MKVDAFKHLISVYGADSNQWPEDQRGDARNFCQDFPSIADPILRGEAQLDAALMTVTHNPPSDLIKGRILRDIQKANVSTQNNSKQVIGWRAIAAMMVVSFSVGVAGTSFVSSLNSQSDETTLVAATDDTWLAVANDLDLLDVYSWAEGTDTAAADGSL